VSILVGDKFKTASGIWEVIGLKPGGKVELFKREKVRFMDSYTKNVRTWERVGT
jgi:hypothetical protein